MKLSKNVMIGGVIVAVLLVGGGALAYKKASSKNTTSPTSGQTKKKKVAEPVNAISVDQRPYVQISPLADGRNLEVIIKAIQKPAQEAEYELEYQAGSLLQGAFGTIKLAPMPGIAKILLGSCSAGGACTYHTDISKGTLLLRFKGSENYALKSDWHYYENLRTKPSITSDDGKFSLSTGDLKSQRYAIIYNTPGYPAGLPGTPISDPFSLAVSDTLKGMATVTIQSDQTESAKIMSWNGKSWNELKTTVKGNALMAEGELSELYILVKK